MKVSVEVDEVEAPGGVIAVEVVDAIDSIEAGAMMSPSMMHMVSLYLVTMAKRMFGHMTTST